MCCPFPCQRIRNRPNASGCSSDRKGKASVPWREKVNGPSGRGTLPVSPIHAMQRIDAPRWRRCVAPGQQDDQEDDGQQDGRLR